VSSGEHIIREADALERTIAERWHQVKRRFHN
jgi:hypothetical protein